MCARLAGILPKRAIAAVIAAKRGQRNENFFREGNDSSLPLSAKLACSGEEIREWSVLREAQSARPVEDAGFARRGAEVTGEAVRASLRRRRHLGLMRLTHTCRHPFTVHRCTAISTCHHAGQLDYAS